MEWTIPLHNLDISKISIAKPSQGSKLISPISYTEDPASFYTLSILLPLLPVKSYDASSGRLQISLQGQNVLSKLQQFQEMIISTVHANQATWFVGEKISDKEDIRHGFQPFIEHGLLNVYCPCLTPNEIYNYTGKQWTRGALQPSMFSTGRLMRLAIKFQGVSFHQHPISRIWTGKFRLQHRIMAIMTN
jgi:hypothetical protein